MGTVEKWKLCPLIADLNETRVGNRDQIEESVFQIIPKFCLEKNDQRSELPSKKSILSCLTAPIRGNKNFAVAVESELLILDSKFEKLEKHLQFNHHIDFLNYNASLILLGLSSSELVFINSSTLEVFDTRFVESEEEAQKLTKRNTECQFFVNGHIFWRGDICFVVAVNVNGNVYHIQMVIEPNNTLDFTRLEKTNLLDSDNTTLPLTDTMKAAISGSTMVTSSFFFGLKYVVLAEKCGCRISLVELVGDTENEFGVRGLQTSDLLKDLGIKERGITIKKLARCEGLLFVLLSTGRLEILFDECLFPTNSLKLPIKNGYIHDFEAVLSGEEVKLWTIFSSQDDEAHLAVFSGPSFLPELLVAVPISSWIPEGRPQHKDSAINIRFNVQSSYFDEPSLFTLASANGIKFFQVMESSTDTTLQRLLAQGKFNLADALARKYSVDIDVVKKARVLAHFKDLVNLKNAKSEEQIFQLMISILESIVDNNFVCTFCICDHENMLPRIEWVQKLLNIGLKRVHAVDVELGTKLLLIGKKFYTFQQVMPSGSSQDWREFCHPQNSMFDVCHRFIQNGEYEYCNCVWTRHGDAFVEDLDLNTLGTVFWALFCQQLSTPACISLFTTVLDDTLSKCVGVFDNQQEQESKLNGMLELVKKQICFLETKVNWPHEAVKFVEILVSIFHNEEAKFMGMIQNERLIELEWKQKLVLCQKCSDLLKYLLQALMELVELRTSHSMRISFTKFINEDLTEVVNALFDELFVREEITSFVEKFLKPFALRKSLDLDFLYLKHIESVLPYVPFFTNMAQIPYEERLFCLVELITNMKIKLTALLQMVGNWPVPWSPGLDVLVSRILDTNSDVTVSREEYEACQRLLHNIALVRKQVPYQCILNKYNLTASKLTSSTSIQLGLKRILLSKKPGCEQDALELVKHTGKSSEEFVSMFSVQLRLLPLSTNNDSVDSTDKNDYPDTLVPKDLSKQAMIKLKDRCFASIESASTFGDLYSKELLTRQSKIAKMLSHKLNDTKAIEFLGLRTLITNLEDRSILYAADYPLRALELMLGNLHMKSSKEIINECNKLSAISFYPCIEILVAVVIAFANLSYVSTSIIDKTWEILMELVRIPSTLRSPLLRDHLESALHLLIMHSPFNSYEHQVVLDKFLVMVVESFGAFETRFCKLLVDGRIFMSLRKREIPLEKEFLAIYKVLSGEESKSFSFLQKELENIGRNLIKYGQHDLMVAIMNVVLLEYDQWTAGSLSEEDLNFSRKIVDCFSKMKKRLVEESYSYKETETDPHILSLVKSLCEAGIFVNAFSLRHRNKGTLIKKLLDIKEFRLASEVALVFSFRDKEPWSNILKGFMESENPRNLQRLLTQLKGITELWTIPDFTIAWLKVSETNPSFKNLCPIPLI